jgi:hypothetical protein
MVIGAGNQLKPARYKLLQETRAKGLPWLARSKKHGLQVVKILVAARNLLP